MNSDKNDHSKKPTSIDDAIELLDSAMEGQHANLKDMMASEYQSAQSGLPSQNFYNDSVATPPTAPSLSAIGGILAKISSGETLRSVSDSFQEYKTQGVGKSKELYGVAFDRSKEFYGKTSLRSKELYGQTLDRSRELYGQTVDRSKALATDVDTRVRANPWPVIGGLAVGGFALGLFIGLNGNRKQVVTAEIVTTELE